MFEVLTPYLARFGDMFSLSTPTTLFYFVMVLSVIVFVHEYGHFIVGRWCGCLAEEFSIGFGREIFGWTDRRGTRWKVCWLPLGGYVRFPGDENAASMPVSAASEPVGLLALPVWKRALVFAAGPVANFLFAIVIFSIFLAFNGKTILEPRLSEVKAGSRAEAAGFKRDDLILSIDGVTIHSFGEILPRVVISAEQQMNFKVQRGDTVLNIAAAPKLEKIQSRIGAIDGGLMGFSVDPREPGRLRRISLSPLQAVAEGGHMTWAIIDQSLSTIGKILTGRVSFSQLSGPIDIARLSGKIAEDSLLDLVQFAAFLSVSIGMVNLLPIPVLDGGHLLFCLIESIRRRPLTEKIQGFALIFGLAIILTVFLLVSWGSVVRMFSS